MAIFPHPQHVQLRHQLLRNAGIADAAQAATWWAVHKASFADMLRLVAENQARRFPGLIAAYPPETAVQPPWKVAYGFILLVVKDPDLTLLVPELSVLPSLTYPYREVPGGRTGKVLVVDGWTGGEPTGLLGILPTVRVQLDGTLSRANEAAFDVFRKLQVVLDATLRIRDIRGPARAALDSEGWRQVPYLRRGSGRLFAEQGFDQQLGCRDFPDQEAP